MLQNFIFEFSNSFQTILGTPPYGKHRLYYVIPREHPYGIVCGFKFNVGKYEQSSRGTGDLFFSDSLNAFIVPTMFNGFNQEFVNFFGVGICDDSKQ